MVLLRKIGKRINALFRRARLESELDEEIRFHLEMQTAKHLSEGLTEQEARRRARLDFGAIERFREEAREARGVRPLEDLFRDIRVGLRVLTKRPGFTLAVLTTLGLGVAGSSAIFGTVNGVLLSPLPYPEADRVMAVWEQDRTTGDDRVEVSPANFLDWRERSVSFEHLASMEPYGFDWLRSDGPVYVPTWLVSEGFFEAFGVPALHGRTFRPDEHVDGRAAVIVLGYQRWQTVFGGDPEVVGRTLDFEGTPFEVIGIMPQGFAVPHDDAVWAPKTWQGWEQQARTSHFYRVYGRLRPLVTVEQAQSEMDTIAAQLGEEYPGSNADSGVALVSLPEQVLGRVRGALSLLLGAVALVLLVVTANIASMQLARAVGRTKEFALRAALGAGRYRVARELFLENVLLALGGAGLGFSLAYLALRLLRSIAPSNLPRVHQIQADWVVLVFAVSVSLVALLPTGMLPTFMVVRSRLSPALTEGGRGATSSRWVRRAQAGLVVSQVCLSLMLLVGAGLLVRSFVSLWNVDRGFRAEGVVTGAVQAWYQEVSDRLDFTQRVTDELRGMPGVIDAGMTSSLPFLQAIGPDRGDLEFPEQPLGPDASAPSVHFSAVTSGYFTTMEIPLRRGRLFDARDGLDDLRVALVNESFVRTYWPRVEPIGRRFAIATTGPPVEVEVVGVVGDVRRQALHEDPRPAVYIPRDQTSLGANVFVLRGTGSPSELLNHLRRAVLQVDPMLPVSPEASLLELVGESVEERRFLMALLAGFAVLALYLAAAGIFGLMSYSVAERSREIGVRMALGASHGDVVSFVLRSGTTLALMGIGLGTLSSLAFARVLAGMLYQVKPEDPITLIVSGGVLLATAVAASSLPAWWAARTDPVRVLHSE